MEWNSSSFDSYSNWIIVMLKAKFSSNLYNNQIHLTLLIVKACYNSYMNTWKFNFVNDVIEQLW